jgi:hypothetical protein
MYNKNVSGITETLFVLVLLRINRKSMETVLNCTINKFQENIYYINYILGIALNWEDNFIQSMTKKYNYIQN